MKSRSFISFFLPFLAYVIFGAISCWATSESLYISYSGSAAIPKIVFWLPVIGIFIMASIGTRMIIESVNPQVYMEHRRWKFIGGCLIVIIFWFLFILPTNAHTFLYKHSAKTVAQRELKWQEKQLSVITDVDTYAENLKVNIDQKITYINQQKVALLHEINNPYNSGFGEKQEMILQEIEEQIGLETGSIPRTKKANNSKKEIHRIALHYSNAIDEQIKICRTKLEKDAIVLVAQHEDSIMDAKNALKYNRIAYKALDAEGVLQETVLRDARKQINHDYIIIDAYIMEGEESAIDKYINIERRMPSCRLTNVFEVYKDYIIGDLSRKYDMPKTKDLDYFIILSLILDIAAFLFFNITFKVNE